MQLMQMLNILSHEHNKTNKILACSTSTIIQGSEQKMLILHYLHYNRKLLIAFKSHP